MNCNSISEALNRVSKWLLLGIGIVLLLICIPLGVAQTEFGKEQIARMIAAGLSEGPNVRVKLGKLHGMVPFHFRLDHLTVSDRQGEWMWIRDINLHWSPSHLLEGCIHLLEISAADIGIDRLPPEPSKRREAEDMRPNFPEVLPPVILDHLAVKRFTLGEAVLGQRAVFRFGGRITSSELSEGVEGFFRLERMDGPEAEASLKMALKEKYSVLSLRVNVVEESGRLIASVLRVPDPGPLEITLRGEGPLTGWKGQLRASLLRLGVLDAEIGFKARHNPKLTAEGTLQLNRSFLPEPVGGLLGHKNRFALTGLLNANEMVLDDLILTTPRAQLNLGGALDLKHKSLNGEFELKLNHLLFLQTSSVPGPDLAFGDKSFLNARRAKAGIRLGGPVILNGTFSGPMLQPQATITLTLIAPQLEKFQAKKVKGIFSLEPSGPPASPYSVLNIRGKGNAEELTLGGSPLLSEKQFLWVLRGELQGSKSISIPKLEFVGEKIHLAISAKIEPTALRGTADVEIKIRDLDILSEFSGLALSGSASLHAKVEGDGRNRSLSAQIKGHLRNLGQIPSSITGLIGEDISYSAKVKLAEAGILSISVLHLDTAVGKMKADASVDIFNKRVRGQWWIDLPRLAAFSPVLKHEFAGSVKLDGEIGGSFTSPELNARAKVGDLVVEGRQFPKMVVSLRADGLFGNLSGDAALNLKHGRQLISAKTGFMIKDRHLRLSPLSLKAGSTKITGHLFLDLNGILAEGELQGISKDLSSSLPILEEKIEGRATVKAWLSASLEGQELRLELKGEDLATQWGEAKEVFLGAHIKDVFNTPHGTANADIDNFRKGNLTVAGLALNTTGNARHLTFSGGVRGRYKESFEVETRGTFAASRDHKRLEIDHFQGNYGKHPVFLKQPVTIQQSSNGYTVDSLLLKAGPGRLQASGKLQETDLSFKANFEDLPLAPLNLAGVPDLTGHAAGQIQLSGKPENPEMSIQVHLSWLRLHDTLSDLPAITLTAKGKLEESRLGLELEVTELTEKPIKADVAVPMFLCLSPFGFSFPPQGEFNGNLTAEADLDRIASFIAMDDQSLAGRLIVVLKIGGPVDAPKLTGSCHVLKGSYENVKTGTILGNIELDAVASGERLVIKNIRATDGEEGTISAQGWINLVPLRDLPFQIDITFNEAALLRNDDMTAVSSGHIKCSGSLKEAALTGKVTVVPAEFRIPERMPPEMTELNVIEINRPAHEIVPPTGPQSPLIRKLRLDLEVELPGRIFVRGRGLESEWEGSIKVSGYAHDPVIRGALRIIRGHFNFFGEHFSLAKGLISFDGSVPPSPKIDMTGETSADDMNASLHISGPISSLRIKLDSDPPLPSDEVLARLLFGRSLRDITPIQGLQLVQAMNSLMGDGETFDFGGRMRRLMGLDLLEFKQNQEGIERGAINIGKYVTEDTFIQVEKGLGSEGGKITVEMELTSNIAVETEAGTNAEGGMELKWKWDY